MDRRLKKILSNKAKDLARVVNTSNTLLKNDSIIIFTCGARPDPINPKARDVFLAYAENHMPGYNFFMAENFFDVFKDKNGSDLLTLEESMADYSDCIILILESESTFAELGAFAISDKIAEICLVVNEVKYKDSPSFINQGPLKKLNKVSIFGSVINTKLKSLTTSCNQIEDRLQNQIKRQRNKSIDISTYNKFVNAKPKHRLLFILDLISIFSPMKFGELIEVLIELYGENDFKIHFERTLLEALGLVKSQDDFLFKVDDEIKYYYKYRSNNLIKMRSEVVKGYHKYSRNRIQYLLNR